MNSSGAPLYDALNIRAAQEKLRFHMPGHKGRDVIESGFSHAISLDFTELNGTGNLYEGTPPIADAERLAAKAWRVPQAFFLTGGATSGLFTAIFLAARGGKKLIIDRGCHKCVYHAAAIFGLEPIYLYPKRIPDFNIYGAISPEDAAELLDNHSDVCGVVMTSPTYYGVMSNIEAIAEVTRRCNIPLIIDEAHGAHLPFQHGCGCAVARGADIAVCSMHKTLPALGQSALLTTSKAYSPTAVRRAASIFSTSSPSYDIMASMDLARRYMQTAGYANSAALADSLDKIRKRINEQGIFNALTTESLDPLRLCINTACSGLTGYDGAKILDEDFDIVCEAADTGNILFIITAADNNDDINRLSVALFKLQEYATGHPITLPEFPRAAVASIPPREALMAETRIKPLKESTGCVAGVNLCPYPPGIPIVAMGEVINSEHIAYLLLCGFSPDYPVRVVNI